MWQKHPRSKPLAWGHWCLFHGLGKGQKRSVCHSSLCHLVGSDMLCLTYGMSCLHSPSGWLLSGAGQGCAGQAVLGQAVGKAQLLGEAAEVSWAVSVGSAALGDVGSPTEPLASGSHGLIHMWLQIPRWPVVWSHPRCFPVCISELVAVLPKN